MYGFNLEVEPSGGVSALSAFSSYVAYGVLNADCTPDMGEGGPGCEDPEKLRLCNFACPADGRGAEGTDVVEA